VYKQANALYIPSELRCTLKTWIEAGKRGREIGSGCTCIEADDR
jgi:hypothetical protein